MSVKPKASASSAGGVVIDSTAFETTIEQVKAGAATASSSFEQAQSQFQTKLEEGVSKAMKTAEQISEFNKGNVDAFMKAGTIFANGMQEITKLWAEGAQASVTESVNSFKALTSVKSLKEAVDLQTSFTRGAIEKSLANGSKLTEHSLKLAEEALAPLSARLNAAVEAFTAR